MDVQKFCVKCLHEVMFDTTEHHWCCECFATRTVQTGEFDFDLEFVPHYWIETVTIPQMIEELRVLKSEKQILEKHENFIHDIYGYCYYSVEPGKRAVIFNLYTEPEYRQKGYARKHLQCVIDKIRELGYQGGIEIEAASRDGSVDPKRLVSFYKKMGLEIVECAKNAA